MRRLHLAVLAITSLFVATELLMAQTQPSAAQQETFAILYEPGPRWIKGREIFDQDLQEHGQYMAKLLEQGHLLMGGPFSDSSGGMAIITAKNAGEAADILKKDPGVFKATLRPWYVVFRKAAVP